MLRIYICPLCGNTRIVSNNHDSSCVACDKNMVRTDLPYEKFVNMDFMERAKYISDWLDQCKS